MAQDAQQNALKPPSNVYTIMCILTFVFTIGALTFVYIEGDMFYQFMDPKSPATVDYGYYPKPMTSPEVRQLQIEASEAAPEVVEEEPAVEEEAPAEEEPAAEEAQ